ncbi:hypothetical protein FA95DRAFT_1553440 [Auriscalpium vulgare]|uniref:Uncharacterized protein n=1 Tax=Auriscalpium vulgare TaxID=40419 RepID=A0ACB8S8Z5_9AGAM|nr:hypothetical protein FA95DRAFT_1553440 [Auriscalpium vulgare]
MQLRTSISSPSVQHSASPLIPLLFSRAFVLTASDAYGLILVIIYDSHAARAPMGLRHRN